MTTYEIAEKLVNFCRKGQNALAQVELYDDDIESIESQKNRYKRLKGIAKVQKKTAMFFEMVEEVHSSEFSDPLVIADYFCFKMNLDVTFKKIGRLQLEELCLYHVKNGKIIKEEFFYTPSPE